MSFYTTGGTVQAGDGIYLKRSADTELLQLCQAGEFVYILTARQMGKSSLMEATATRLVEAGIVSVVVDLQMIGTPERKEAWYLGVLQDMADQLMLKTDVYSWWQQYPQLGETQRLTRFFEEVLCAELTEQVVVFVDEIDTTLSLDYTDDFFIAIRYFHEARVRKPELRRLSFVLVGVAMPGDLIKDSQRTPFNIGNRLDVEDFTLAEALPLAKGLKLPESQAKQVLGWVLDWTGGHPYLTQRLCQVLEEEAKKKKEAFDWTKAGVYRVVRQTFLEGGDRSDRNLQFVRDQLLVQKNSATDKEQVLRIFRDVGKGKRVDDDERSVLKSHLKLSGIVKQTKNRRLSVRNKIYGQVFDNDWVKANLPETFVQRYWPILRIAVPATALSLAAALTTGYLSFKATQQQRIAQEKTIQVQSNAAKAYFLANQHLDGMIEAVKAWQSLQAGNWQDSSIILPTQSTLVQSAYQRNNAFEQALTDNFRERNVLQKHDDWVRSVSFSPNGEMIASASNDGKIILWDIQGNELNTLTGHDNWVKSVAFSPDGEMLASASDDGTVKLWDLQGNELDTLEGHDSSVESVAFSSNGEMLASASDDGTVKLWDLQGNELDTLEGHDSSVESVAFSPGGEMLVSANDDRTVKLYDKRSLSPYTLRSSENVTESHNSLVRSVVFSSNGKMIASASDDGTVKLWDLQGNELNTLRGHGNNTVWGIAFSSDSEIIASASEDGTVKLWDLQGNELYTLEGHSRSVKSVAFSDDGKMIASASEDGTVKLWDLQGNAVWSVAFSDDSEMIASASEDGTVKLWDLQGNELYTLRGHGDWVVSVAFSPDNTMLASASTDDTVKLWDVQGHLLHTLVGHSSRVRSVTFNPDSNIIASASYDGTIRLWDIQGNELNTLRGHSDNKIWNVAFSPYGNMVASASEDRTVKLWDLAPQRIMDWHCAWLQDYLQSNPDGQAAAKEGVCQNFMSDDP